MTRSPRIDIVVPTIGRPSLAALLATLGPDVDHRVVVVDDRRDTTIPLMLGCPRSRPDVRVERSGGHGPAAARNIGWRDGDAPWVAFVDDDVRPNPSWLCDLHRDLYACGPVVGGSQGRVHVPLPSERRPTDWERNVAGLATSAWVTADMAYRRAALVAVNGFDERFPRAYREDADIALRVLDAGYELVRGARTVEHPVGPAPWHVSIGKQRGNIDDALMQRLHGGGWRDRIDAPRGTFCRHVAVSAAGLAAVVGSGPLACLAATAWVFGTGAFAWKRIAPGPRTGAEVAAMAVTSAVVPPTAVVRRLAGVRRARRVAPPARRSRIEAVLVDRDGTIIGHVPYNSDPAPVRPLDGARQALYRLRAAGIRVPTVSNQGGVAAGARPILVPTPVTRREEIAAAPEVARSLEDAVELLVGRAR
jgi:hypothetical protein